ncbi:hypothetical protein [Streptosporangium roseum]|uniref:hypothetical protein n=1 Tax=Streptosporangium roseum TaxID=2001 RepID=UPI0001A3F0E1|nr:hypothetical protein [Streptosporangium roseum]
MEIERERLRAIMESLSEAAGPVDKVIQGIVGLTVAESAFTSFTYSLAVAYSEVEAFTLQELRRKTEDTVEMAEMVGVSAGNWTGAEHAGTVKAV